MLLTVEATRSEGIWSLLCPWGGRALCWSPTKDWIGLSTSMLWKELLLSKGSVHISYISGSQNSLEIEASMVDSECLDTAIYLSILKMDCVELMCWAIRLRWRASNCCHDQSFCVSISTVYARAPSLGRTCYVFLINVGLIEIFKAWVASILRSLKI